MGLHEVAVHGLEHHPGVHDVLGPLVVLLPKREVGKVTLERQFHVLLLALAEDLGLDLVARKLALDHLVHVHEFTIHADETVRVNRAAIQRG